MTDLADQEDVPWHIQGPLQRWGPTSYKWSYGSPINRVKKKTVTEL